MCWLGNVYDWLLPPAYLDNTYELDMLAIWAFFEKVCMINSFEFVTGNKFFYDNRFRFGAHHWTDAYMRPLCGTS